MAIRCTGPAGYGSLGRVAVDNHRGVRCHRRALRPGCRSLDDPRKTARSSFIDCRPGLRRRLASKGKARTSRTAALSVAEVPQVHPRLPCNLHPATAASSPKVSSTAFQACRNGPFLPAFAGVGLRTNMRDWSTRVGVHSRWASSAKYHRHRHPQACLLSYNTESPDDAARKLYGIWEPRVRRACAAEDRHCAITRNASRQFDFRTYPLLSP